VTDQAVLTVKPGSNTEIPATYLKVAVTKE
jgi:hypothetical protein